MKKKRQQRRNENGNGKLPRAKTTTTRMGESERYN